MSTTATPQSVSTEAVETTDIEYIAVELEYPIAMDPASVPVSPVQSSTPLRNANGGRGSDWRLDGLPTGTMGSDHTGAEITPPPLELHTTQPEDWYRQSVAKATQMGYPFGATGRTRDSTNFGLHFNLSPVPREKAEALYAMLQEPWSQVFFCASVNDYGADPWRFGGISSQTYYGDRSFGNDYALHECGDSIIDYDRNVGAYYEFRLPEPGLPNHVAAMFQFFRLLDAEGPEAAEEYARDMVYDASPVLTPVQQYEMLSESESWFERAFDDGNRNRSDVAEFMGEIMGDI